MSPGRFITFEGIDGCGKTTQLRAFAAWLRESGRDVVETVEPGGTPIGREARRVLLDPASVGMDPRTELLLYFASRAQNVAETIRPALAAGKIVVCDRFTDSTLVYQGCGRGLDSSVIRDLDRIACAGLQPDLTVLIDIDVATSTANRLNSDLAVIATIVLCFKRRPYEDCRRVVQAKPSFQQVSLALGIVPLEFHMIVYA